MGVEIQHCVLYGYEMPIMDYEDYKQYYHHDPQSVDDEPEFVVLQEPRGHRWCYAGLLRYRSKSVRWNGAQHIPPINMERPDPILVQAMNHTIAEELPEEPLHDEPEHYAFTHNW